MYDCYYDASYYAEKKNGIAGVYVEDITGEILLEKQFLFEGIEDSQQAEAYALGKAIEVMRTYHGVNFRLMGDCKSLIEGVWEGAGSFERLRDQMKEARISCNQLVWIYREYNKAHNVTKPIHIEKERPVYEANVRYALTMEAYEQYSEISGKQKPKPQSLVELKLNHYIEEVKYFCMKMEEGVQAYFRYGFIIFVQNGQIVALYKSEDNRNQYGNCKKKPSLLTAYFEQVYVPVKNQA